MSCLDASGRQARLSGAAGCRRPTDLRHGSTYTAKYGLFTFAHAWSAEWNVVRLRRTPPDFILLNRDNTCRDQPQRQHRRKQQQQQWRKGTAARLNTLFKAPTTCLKARQPNSSRLSLAAHGRAQNTDRRRGKVVTTPNSKHHSALQLATIPKSIRSTIRSGFFVFWRKREVKKALTTGNQ